MGWAELCPDVLPLIAKKVGDISNFIRLRAVCKRWRSALHPSDQPPQLPWYIKFKTNAESKSSCDLQFFSLYSNKTHTLPLPLPISKAKSKLEALNSSSAGYIFIPTYEDHNGNTFGSLLNPITGSQVSIPFGCNVRPVLIGDTTSPIKNGVDALIWVWETCSESDSSTLKVCFWRYIDKSWTKIFEFPSDDECLDVFYNGRLFLYYLQSTRVIDYRTGDEVLAISDLYVRYDYITDTGCDLQFSYLIEAGGDLLGIKKSKISNANYNIEVYRLENTGKNSFWVKMNGGIGDWVVILNNLCGFCLKASDFDGFKGNCIYFKDYDDTDEDNQCKFVLIRYDMESSKAQVLIRYDMGVSNEEVLFCSERFNGTWFVPSLS